MNSQLFSSSPYLSLLCSFLVILLKIQSCSSYPPNESFCSAQFECGNIAAGYPFSRETGWWDGCGPPQFKLICKGDRHDLPTMMINHVKYKVLEIRPKVQTLRIARMLEYLDGVCPEFPNTTFDSTLFNYADPAENENVTLNYNCPPSPSYDYPKPTDCQVNGVKYKDGFVPADGPKNEQEGCNANVSVPVPRHLLQAAKSNWSEWQGVLQQGFELKWEKPEGMPCEDCTNSKGNCRLDYTFSNKTICYCPDTDRVIFDGSCPPPLGTHIFIYTSQNQRFNWFLNRAHR